MSLVLIFASAEMKDSSKFFTFSDRIDLFKIYNDEQCNSYLNKSQLYFYNDRFIVRDNIYVYSNSDEFCYSSYFFFFT